MEPVHPGHARFAATAKKLLAVTQHRVSDKTTMHLYLEELNKSNHQSPLDADEVMLLINRLCMNVQVWETSLVISCCRFLATVAKTVRISERTLVTAKKWIFQVLEFSEVDAKNAALISLKSFIDASTFGDLTNDLETLIGNGGLFRRTVELDSPETRSLTVSCVEAALDVKEDGILPTKHKRNVQELVLFVLHTLDNSGGLWSTRGICASLRILTKLIAEKILEDSPEACGELLGVVQVFLFYGIPGYPLSKVEQLRPAVLNLPERIHVPPKGRGTRSIAKSKGKRSRKPEKPKIQDAKSSDSEASDGEQISVEKIEGKVRGEALKLLHEVIKETPSREMFGFWSQVITSGGVDGQRVLLRYVMKETVAKLRQAALSTLTDAVIDARMFLTHADEAEHPSFVTIFGTVGAMLRELHLSLALFLSSERNIAVVTQALKCSAALVQVTPYHKLKPGLATRLARHCRFFLLHRDPTVRVVALSVFEAFAAVEYATPEIIGILYRKSRETNLSKKLNFSDEENSDARDANSSEQEEEVDFSDLEGLRLPEEPTEDCKSHEEDDTAFLVKICLRNISDKKVHVPVRLQSFKLLGALVNSIEIDKFVGRIYMDVMVVTRYLVEATQEADPQVSLHACRVLEMISSRLSTDSISEDSSLGLWNAIFPAVVALSQNSETILREVACDCFGTISNGVFARLSHDKTIIIKTTLFGACRDEESAVRAAGLRSLGMLINLPQLEEDTGFVEDLAEVVCRSLEDENLGVRIKGTWALANLTDCLIKQVKNEEIEPLPLEVVLPSLYRTSVSAAQDNNKVKCNALRAVGNVLYLSQGRNVLGDTEAALRVLIACATRGNDMKVRWNACRALGFAISCSPDEIFPQNWKDEVIPVLCDLICHSPNFKVRTNAAWALANCRNYGKYVPFLWKSIVLALENSQHVPNFVEYAHRDSLVQQLCLTLGHVAARTDPSDLQILWPDIKDHIEDIEVHMRSFQEKVLPEKTDDFVRAKLILKNYSQTMSLHSNERLIADVLGNLFDRRCLYEELENTVLVS